MQSMIATYPLSELRLTIAQEVTTHAHLRAIRDHNRTIIGVLKKMYRLGGVAMLDLGASIHGYGLEAALDAGVQIYEGIDLDVSRHWSQPSVTITGSNGAMGRLQEMNAETLHFGDTAFDCLLSISTFEHFLRPDVVLSEMFRVLRPGGVALVSFEPIWTASNGHHLHHFGAIGELVPPWSHLFLSERQMRELLAHAPWPSAAPISREDALDWIYRGSGINRLSVGQLRNVFEASPFEIVWIQPLPGESGANGVVAEYVSRLTSYSIEDLLVRGLSLLLRKE